MANLLPTSFGYFNKQLYVSANLLFTDKQFFPLPFFTKRVHLAWQVLNMWTFCDENTCHNTCLMYCMYF